MDGPHEREYNQPQAGSVKYLKCLELYRVFVFWASGSCTFGWLVQDGLHWLHWSVKAGGWLPKCDADGCSERRWLCVEYPISRLRGAGLWWNFWWMLSCVRVRYVYIYICIYIYILVISNGLHPSLAMTTLLMHCRNWKWKALQWIRVETFFLSLGLRWHQTANLMPSWCPQKPRTKSSHHCRTFGHRYFGNLNAWRGKSFSDVWKLRWWSLRVVSSVIHRPQVESWKILRWTRFASRASQWKRERESESAVSILSLRILRDETCLVCLVFVWCISTAICSQVTTYYIWQTTGCNFTAGALYAVAMYLTTTAGVPIQILYEIRRTIFIHI